MIHHNPSSFSQANYHAKGFTAGYAMYVYAPSTRNSSEAVNSDTSIAQRLQQGLMIVHRACVEAS